VIRNIANFDSRIGAIGDLQTALGSIRRSVVGSARTDRIFLFPRLSSMRFLATIGTTLLLLSSVGCVTPWNTQLPTPYANHPAVETRRNEQFDPFARADLGPDTMSRPREYTDPRATPRQAADSEIRQAPQVPGVTNPANAPNSTYPTQQYPGVVPF